jgi:hypothetical protein
MNRLFLAAIFCLSTLGCSSQHFGWPKTYPVNWRFADLSASEREIYSATIDWMMNKWGSKETMIFIQLFDADPPADLLAQFSSRGYKVDVGSRYRHGRGLEFDVGKVRFPGSGTAVVPCGYLYADLAGHWGDLTLTKRSGKWKVREWTQTAIAQSIKASKSLRWG